MITLRDAFKIALSPCGKYRICLITDDKETGKCYSDFEYIPGKKNDTLFWKYENQPCILIYPYYTDSNALGIEFTVKITN